MGRRTTTGLAIAAVMVHCLVGCCVRCVMACDHVHPESCSVSCSAACDRSSQCVCDDHLCGQPEDNRFEPTPPRAGSHPRQNGHHCGCGHSKYSFILTESPSESLSHWAFLSTLPLPQRELTSADVAIVTPARADCLRGAAPHSGIRLRLHLSLAVLII